MLPTIRSRDARPCRCRNICAGHIWASTSRQPGVDRSLEERDAARRVAVVMPYHVLGSSILPGTELILTVPARLVSQFADSSRVCVLGAPRELGDVQFHAVGHPRLDEDPSHRLASPGGEHRCHATARTSTAREN